MGQRIEQVLKLATAAAIIGAFAALGYFAMTGSLTVNPQTGQTQMMAVFRGGNSWVYITPEQEGILSATVWLVGICAAAYGLCRIFRLPKTN